MNVRGERRGQKEKARKPRQRFQAQSIANFGGTEMNKNIDSIAGSETPLLQLVEAYHRAIIDFDANGPEDDDEADVVFDATVGAVRRAIVEHFSTKTPIRSTADLCAAARVLAHEHEFGASPLQDRIIAASAEFAAGYVAKLQAEAA